MKTQTDAEKARLLLRQAGFATGGKRTDNRFSLTPGYKLKKKSGIPGPSLGTYGYLHTFVLRETLWESLKLNLYTKEDIAAYRIFPEGIGVAPWDAPLTGEACENAVRLRESLMGRLVPMNRFCLLTDDGMHCTEGIRHPDRKDGVADPSVSIDRSGKEPTVLWVDPERRPWRMLPAMLQFFAGTGNKGYDCPRLRMGLDRHDGAGFLRIWSGGLRISFTSGEQIVKDSDDYVESVYDTDYNGELLPFSIRFGEEMKRLEDLSSALSCSIKGYYRELQVQNPPTAALALGNFWHAAEEHASELFSLCNSPNREALQKLRLKIFRAAESAFDEACPCGTPKQISAWVKHRISGRKFLKSDKETK